MRARREARRARVAARLSPAREGSDGPPSVPVVDHGSDDDDIDDNPPVARHRPRSRVPAEVQRFVAGAATSEDESDDDSDDDSDTSGGPPAPDSSKPPAPAPVSVPRALCTLDQVPEDADTGDYCYLCVAAFTNHGNSLAYCIVWDFILRNIESIPTELAARVRVLFETVIRGEMGAVPPGRNWSEASILAHVFDHGATEATTLLSCERKVRAAIRRVMQTEVLSTEHVGTDQVGGVRANLRGIGSLRQLSVQLCTMTSKRVEALRSERQVASRKLERAAQKQRTRIGALAAIESARSDEVHTAMARSALREKRQRRMEDERRERKRRRRE